LNTKNISKRLQRRLLSASTLLEDSDVERLNLVLKSSQWSYSVHWHESEVVGNLSTANPTYQFILGAAQARNDKSVENLSVSADYLFNNNWRVGAEFGQAKISGIRYGGDVTDKGRSFSLSADYIFK